jgi:hypothetical protein
MRKHLSLSDQIMLEMVIYHRMILKNSIILENILLGPGPDDLPVIKEGKLSLL